MVIYVPRPALVLEQVPVERAGKDLLSLKVNEKLTGTVIA